ncbi:MAG TPA: YncE family protein [Anaerolineae bacterium]|nr:YncE family protein [Anaerolineae bacterium]
MTPLQNLRYRHIGAALIGLALLIGASGVLAQGENPSRPLNLANFDSPTTSSPITLDVSKNLIWIVNPDDDSVSVIGNLNTTPSVIAKFIVGNEPQSIALDTNNSNPSQYHAYVANAADNTVTVINVTNSTASSVTAAVQATLTTGAEPWNVVASPDGRRVFVANSAQDTLTVINTQTAPPSILGNVRLDNSACNAADSARHFQPRGLAVTLDNTKLYVTRFLSFVKAGGVQGDDSGKEGLVCRLDINTGAGTIGGSVTGFTPIALAARDTDFKIDKNGDSVPDATFAYPNQLQSIVIRGDRAYLPNIASSPSAPLRFNVDTQAFVNVIGGATGSTQTDLGALNLHLGARDPEPGKTKLFFANPWAIAFTTPNGPGNAYVVSAGSDLLVKLNVDTSGTITFTGDISTTRYIDLHDPNNAATSGLNAGKNPLGLVIRNIAPGNNKAYVLNYLSRNVSVVNLDTDSVTQVIQTVALPPAGTQEEQLLVGKEMFFASRGVFNGGKVNRLSSEGWQNCASCHFNGLTDGTVWAFGAGPRKSAPLAGTWSPHNPDDQRILNYSAIFDEVEDFELNIRNVSGPGPLSAGPPPVLDPNHGLIISDTGDINTAPAVINAFAKANAGRPQLSVTLPGSATAWPALEALREWVRFGIRTPNGKLTTSELTAGGGNSTGGLNPADVTAGRRLFFQAGCQVCHGGAKWTISNKDFVSPPAAAEIFTENPPVATTVNAQYLNRFLRNINSFNLGVVGAVPPNPIGNNIGAIEKATDGKDGLGKDYNGDGAGVGFNVPALLGIWNVPPYYHNGACETLGCVLSNVAHRTKGLRPGQSDPFTVAANRDRVNAFLQSLDAETAFPTNLRIEAHDIFLDPPVVFSGAQVIVGANVSLFGTRVDLTDTLQVRFTAPGLNVQAPLPVSAFNQDFGQAIITTTWAAPNTPGLATISVQVDSTNTQIEANENDNTANRRIIVRPPPPDRTPPVVESARISDDNPFNENDPIANTTNVQVKIRANDPDPDGGGPAVPSGLKKFCIVRYYYSSVDRRWIPQTCAFQLLPAPQGDGSFLVNTTLTPRAGTAYAFVWVQDGAGNISRTPGFDVISFIPSAATNINLNRNEVRLFRVLLTPGQQLTFNFSIVFGDVDVSVFDGISPTANRIAVSAQNGAQPETVTINVPPAGAATTFQIEVRAAVNSRFRISTEQSLAAQTAPAWSDSVAATNKVLPTEPFIGGPPALQTAIEELAVYLPLILRTP